MVEQERDKDAPDRELTLQDVLDAVNDAQEETREAFMQLDSRINDIVEFQKELDEKLDDLQAALDNVEWDADDTE